MTQRILLVGATSGIGRALARALAGRKHELVLAGRSEAEIERIAQDLRIRFDVRISSRPFEACSFEMHEELLRKEFEVGLDGILLTQGQMVDPAQAETDFDAVRTMIDVNYVSSVSLLERAAPHFERQGYGWICAVSSVAGDRGRRSNYLYGSTKAALDVYLEGLEARLAPAGVTVLTVKPGFVDTRLTYGTKVPFSASPERVARDVIRGIERKRSVVYTPGFWWIIMAVLRFVPRRIFRRLPL